jgi:hypothetical protein
MDMFKILNYQFWDVIFFKIFLIIICLAQGSFWPSGLGTRNKKKKKLFVNINPSSSSHAYNEYGGEGTDKVRPMSQLGNIHVCRYLV